MKPRKLLVFLLAVLMVVTMAVPALAAALGENTGSQTGESYFDPATAVTTLTPTAVSGTSSAVPTGTWRFQYPVVIHELSYTVVNAEDAATGRFEGYVGSAGWKTIGNTTESGAAILSTSTYSFTEIRYTGDPAAVTNVKFKGQVLHGVVGEILEPKVSTISGGRNDTTGKYTNGKGPEKALDHDRATNSQHNWSDSNAASGAWITFELENPAIITAAVMWNYNNAGGYMWSYNTKIQGSLDGTNWTDCQINMGGFIGSTTQTVNYTMVQWTAEVEAQVRANPSAVKITEKTATLDTDTAATVIYDANWKPEGGYVLPAHVWTGSSVGTQYSSFQEYKYIRIYADSKYTVAYQDISLYGVDGFDGIPLRNEWAFARNTYAPIQDLTPIIEKQTAWQMPGQNYRITKIDYTATASLAGGVFYGLTETNANRYEIGRISDDATGGSITVNSTIGFEYIVFVGNADALTNATFTGSQLKNIRGEFLEYAKDANGNAVTVSMGFKTADAAKKANVYKSFNHDISAGLYIAQGNPVTSGNSTIYPIAYGVKLDAPAVVTEVVIFQDSKANARLTSAWLEFSVDGVNWWRPTISGVTNKGAIGDAIADDGVQINQNRDPQGYVFHIDNRQYLSTTDQTNKVENKAYREVNYIRIYRQGPSFGFSFASMDVYGTPFGSASWTFTQGTAAVNAATTPATIAATKLEQDVILTFGESVILTQLNATKCAPDAMVLGSSDGTNWLHLSALITDEPTRFPLTIASTSPIKYLKLSSAVGASTSASDYVVTGYAPGVTGAALLGAPGSQDATGGFNQNHNPIRALYHNRLHQGVASYSLKETPVNANEAPSAYISMMLASPAKITEVMLWPHANFAGRMDQVQIQAATAEDPDNWVTLAFVDLCTGDKTTFNSAIYGTHGTGLANTTTGVKYTINDDTVYSYVRLYKAFAPADNACYDGNLSIAAFEVFGTAASENPLNGDSTASVWFVVAPISLALCGTAVLAIRKKKKSI